MENTIMAGDKVVVTPATEFERNDIVVFDHFGFDYSSPLDEPGQYKKGWQRKIYRLIAYSGDILEIKQGDVYINTKLSRFPENGKTNYEIRSTQPLDELNNEQSRLDGDSIIYATGLSSKQTVDLNKRKQSSISMRKIYARDTFLIVKMKEDEAWSPDFYGPFKIPSPGETIFVDEVNVKMFGNIPGIKPGENVIKEKLYFVMGDNRHGAEDSRYIGLISHSNMFGIVK